MTHSGASPERNQTFLLWGGGGGHSTTRVLMLDFISVFQASSHSFYMDQSKVWSHNSAWVNPISRPVWAYNFAYDVSMYILLI